MRNENLALREDLDRCSMFEEIVGSSPALNRVLAQVAKVAKTDTTVLITGETGTGKELVARAIHKRSRRSTRGYIGVNCAAIPTSLIASELFGGARADRGAPCAAAAFNHAAYPLAPGKMPWARPFEQLRDSIGEVVYRLGFSAPSAFDRAFKSKKVLAAAHEIFKHNQLLLPEIIAPLLVIISLKDRVVPFENARYLMDRVGAIDSTLGTLNDSAHLPTLDYDKQRVQVTCISFIERIVRHS